MTIIFQRNHQILPMTLNHGHNISWSISYEGTFAMFLGIGAFNNSLPAAENFLLFVKEYLD